jgi:acyl-CoA hydrolase
MSTGSWAGALRALPPDGPLYVAGCCGEPTAFLDALAADPDIGRGWTFTGVWIPGVNRRNPTARAPEARALTFFASPDLAHGMKAGRVAILPMHYSTTYRWLAGPARLSGAVFQVTPPRDGTVGLGIAADFTPAAMAAGVPLLGQINPAMPDVPSAPRVPVDRFAALIEAETVLPEYDSGPLSDTFRRIGRHVADLIHPGDTVQLGLGKLQAAVLEALDGAGGLALHGGMVSKPFLAALDRGTFTKARAGVALGDSEFYAALRGETRVAYTPVGMTHDAGVLRAIPRFVSINSILAVDLFGQGNGEFVGDTQVTGHGGLVDFIRGAMASDGGRSILALPSTAGRGAESRIVPRLSPRDPVTVARADVDWVVTEHGAVNLRHATLDERAERLISIADPRFRTELARAWDDYRSGRIADD